MRITELKSNKLEQIKRFARWACKILKIKNQPAITYSNDISHVRDHRTFGSTKPTGEIWCYMGNRNTADIMRTLVHELIHIKQFENGTAHENMDKDQEQFIEDQANAIAGRLMRQYGKQNVEIYESQLINNDSLPQAFAIPQLNSGNPYQQYRFGVAIAAARGQTNKLTKNEWGDNEVIISFDPNIDKIIDQALNDIGISGGKRRIGSKGSKETKDTDKVSPVQAFRGFK